MQLAKISSEFCLALSKTSAPFVVIEYPSLQLEGIEIFTFKAHDYDCSYASHNGKLWQYANPRNKDTIKLLKNSEKEFQKLTKLNNNAHLKLSLYEPKEEKTGKLSVLDRARIKGHLYMDKEFVEGLTEIVRRISN
jgi:hypothetical protein